MKILCGIMGAEAHILNGLHDLSRDTWIRDFSMGDVRFFVGRGDIFLERDEIRLDIPDSKDYILYKTVGILQYALDNGYDRILKVDTDSYINSSEMVKQNLKYDYIGSPVGRIGEKYAETDAYSFMQGSCSWLSAKAAEIVVKESLSNMRKMMPVFQKFDGLICPYAHSEDLWVSQVLTPRILKGELTYYSDAGYTNGPTTFHYAIADKSGVFDWMRKLHENKFNPGRMQQVHKSRVKEVI